MEMQGESTIKKQRLGRRLVLFPVPLQGHLNPMLQLANILHSNGFSITVIHTRFNFPNQSNYPHFTFIPIPDDDPKASSGSDDASDLVFRVVNVNQCYAHRLRDCLSRLLFDHSSSEEGEEPIACLITDALWHFSQSVADSLGLPRIVLRTSSLSCFLLFAALPLLREKGYFSITHQDSQSEAAVPEVPLPQLKVKDIPMIEQEVFFELVANMIKQAKLASGLIWNSFRELEEPELATLVQDFPIPNFPIGPFHNYLPASSSSLLAHDWSSISWLDLQPPNSVLYVSFGSLAGLDETKFLEMAWGLANSKQPFLWVVRPGSVCGSEWLELLPDGFVEEVGGRGHIVKWAPQQEVLAHPATGGFWTHNGWNSTIESICEGVPMICSPSFGDQQINARYVSDVWKVGVQLENGMERGEIERAIKRVMVDEEGEEMRGRIMGLKEKGHICLKKGGSSYQSLESLVNYILSF